MTRAATQRGMAHALSPRGASATKRSPSGLVETPSATLAATAVVSLVGPSFRPKHRHARHEYSRWSTRGGILALIQWARSTCPARIGRHVLARTAADCSIDARDLQRPHTLTARLRLSNTRPGGEHKGGGQTERGKPVILSPLTSLCLFRYSRVSCTSPWLDDCV
jgi:hypothetical protein